MSTYGLYLSAAGMQVNDHRMAVIANNIANAQTAGFKHDLALVRQRLVESRSNPTGFPYVHPVLDGMTGGITPTTTHHSFAQGSIETTAESGVAPTTDSGVLTLAAGPPKAVVEPTSSKARPAMAGPRSNTNMK